MGKIVFIGDSLTKGVGYGGVTTTDTFAYKIGVAKGYIPTDILNKGVNSDTSSGVLARLQTDVLDNSPDVCVLMIGINDWALGVPVATFKSNLQAISTAVRGAGIKLVFMTTNMQRGSAGQIIAQEQYVKVMEEVANDGVVDVFREMALRVVTNDYLPLYWSYSDPIHFSIAGHQWVANVATRPNYTELFVL